MPRKSTSPADTIVSFFMNAPLAEAESQLTTANAIVRERKAQGLKEPQLPMPTARKPRGRKPKQQSLPAADVTAPAPAPATAPPRTRRARRSAGQRPLPPQVVDED